LTPTGTKVLSTAPQMVADHWRPNQHRR
jgi:hypothetical protein